MEVIEIKRELVDDLKAFSFKSDIPLIIRDSKFSKSDMATWNEDTFCEKWGEVDVPVQVYEGGQHHLPHHKDDRGFVKINVKEYFNRKGLGDNGESLLFGKLSTSLFPKMNLSYKLPKVLTQNFFAQKFWLYAKGSVTALHFDVMDTFLVQGKGKKKVFFFEPGVKGMYAFKYFSKTAHFSEVDASNIDFEKYPLMKDKKMYVGEIEEGDILYIPFAWWHQLIGEGDYNFALAFWYYPSLKKALKYFLQSTRLWRIALVRFLMRYPI